MIAIKNGLVMGTTLVSLAVVLGYRYVTKPEVAPWIWACLFIIGGVVEIVAIANSGLGDTLSEQVWALRKNLGLRMAIYAAWSWMTWHFMLEPWFWSARIGYWRDDLVVLAVGVLIAVIYPPKL